MGTAPVRATSPEPLTFSFAYYDVNKERGYCLSSWPEQEIAQSLVRLREISTMSRPQLTQGGKTYRFHPVDWEETTEKGGFPTGVPAYMEPYQFALVGVNGKKARVFGGVYKNTFYIVWFDHDHKIWEMDF